MNRACSLGLSFALATATHLCSQEPPKKGQSYFATTFTIEGNDIKNGCKTTEQVLDDSGKEKTQNKPLKVLVPGCLIPLFHGNKGLYGSFQNLPPSNGLALGLVFKDSELNTGNWRMNYQVDGQGSFNGSWTAGGFLTMRLAPMSETNAATTKVQAQTETPAVPSNPKKPRILHPPIVHQGPVPKRLPDLYENEIKLLLNFYAFHTSLKQVSFFGLGPNTVPADRSFFALAETVTGVNADLPLKYGFHLLGELNGRWPTIGSDHGQSSPSIEQIYSEVTAPGLTRQPAFLQLGEGLQYIRHIGGLGERNFGADFDMDWEANFQQFFAPSISAYSFRRLTLDAITDVNLLKRFKPKYGSSTSEHFGTLQLRGWLAESIASAGHVVPFYFQPTLGGGDVNKERTLPSFADYRFRAPNALLLRAEYEQPLPRYSFLGVIFQADTGKVAVAREDIDFSHLRHSYGVGFTIRAGNFPYLIFMYAWGGEGHHTFADLNLSAISPGGGPASLW